MSCYYKLSGICTHICNCMFTERRSHKPLQAGQQSPANLQQSTSPISPLYATGSGVSSSPQDKHFAYPVKNLPLEGAAELRTQLQKNSPSLSLIPNSYDPTTPPAALQQHYSAGLPPPNTYYQERGHPMSPTANITPGISNQVSRHLRPPLHVASTVPHSSARRNQPSLTAGFAQGPPSSLPPPQQHFPAGILPRPPPLSFIHRPQSPTGPVQRPLPSVMYAQNPRIPVGYREQTRFPHSPMLQPAHMPSRPASALLVHPYSDNRQQLRPHPQQSGLPSAAIYPTQQHLAKPPFEPQKHYHGYLPFNNEL